MKPWTSGQRKLLAQTSIEPMRPNEPSERDEPFK